MPMRRPMALSSLHVCRQLQLCLPGVRVFLDVDDLKDISALESSIEQSAVVLIFLSKNYFGSRNWFASHRNRLASRSACIAPRSRGEGPCWSFHTQCHAYE